MISLSTLCPNFSRLLHGELSYVCTVAVAITWGTLFLAAMTSLASFAILKTLYIVSFDRVNEISDASLVQAIQGFTLGLPLALAFTEITVKVEKVSR